MWDFLMCSIIVSLAEQKISENIIKWQKQQQQKVKNKQKFEKKQKFYVWSYLTSSLFAYTYVYLSYYSQCKIS